MKNNYLKKTVTTLLLVAFLPLMPSCTGKVTSGASDFILGAIIVGVADKIEKNKHRTNRRPITRTRRPRLEDRKCDFGYEEVCRSNIDYNGNESENCTCVRNRPSDRYRSQVDITTEELTAEDYSVAYDMSVESGARLKDAIERAVVGDLDGLMEIGFTDEAIIKIAMLTLPSEEEIDSVARELNQDPIITKSIINKLIILASAELKKVCEEQKLDDPICQI